MSSLAISIIYIYIYLYLLRFTKKEKVSNVAKLYLTDQYIHLITRPSLPE